MKVGDKVVRAGGNFCEVFAGEHYRIREVRRNDVYVSTLEGKPLSGLYVKDSFVVIPEVVEQQKPNYAAAFNAWMSDYVNNPQAYENSHDSAVRHLKEKLNGEEPSYGEVCAEVLVNYLNKLESK